MIDFGFRIVCKYHFLNIAVLNAQVAELVDAQDLKILLPVKAVSVRFRSWAQ